jgi:hypothetical protein
MNFLKVTFKDYATFLASSKPSLFLVISWDMNLDQMCAVRDATNLRLADPVCVLRFADPFYRYFRIYYYDVIFINIIFGRECGTQYCRKIPLNP